MSNGSVSSPSVFRLGEEEGRLFVCFLFVVFLVKETKQDYNIRNMLIAEIHVSIS